MARIKTGGGNQIPGSNRRFQPRRRTAEFQKIQACLRSRGSRSAARSPAGQQNGQNGRQGGLGGGQNHRRASFRQAGGDRGAFAKCLPARLHASAPRSRRRSRRCSRSSTRPRRTSRAGATRSPASIRRRPTSASSLLPWSPAGFHRRRQGRREARGTRLQHVREPAGAEGRLQAEPERDGVYGGRFRAAAARRPRPRTSTSRCRSSRCFRARRALSTSSSSAPRTARRSATCRRRSRTSIRGPRSRARRTSPTRSAGRSSTPRASPSGSARRSRSWPRGRLPARDPPHPVLGRQARAGVRDAEGARLDAVARDPPGPGRVARPGGARRPARRRPRHRRRVVHRRVRTDADRELEHRRRRRLFGLGEVTARSVSDQVALSAPIAAGVLLAGFLLAVVGGLVAGAAGAFRASRLRPADALRQVE